MYDRKIRYSLTIPNLLDHFLHVQIVVPCTSSGKTTLILPDWRPGRYQLMNYAARLSSFSACNEHGAKLQSYKEARNVWIVETSDASSIIVSYLYYANEMDAGSSMIDAEQVYVNFINCLMFEPSMLAEPVVLSVEIPEKYQVACALPMNAEGLLEAKDYYELVDSPYLACEDLRFLDYTVDGTNFNLAIKGDMPLEDSKVLDVFKAFTKDQIKTFGEFPASNFLFIVHVLPYRHYHGVEHRDSTVLVLGLDATGTADDFFNALVGLASHELFHAWNVTRIRPKEMMPYDFSKENYHETGFVTEGITSYYGDLALVRSGVFDEEQYRDELNRLLRRHFENYGRHQCSITEASYDLWVDGYGSKVPFRKPSIYVKGALIALVLDLFIRRKTHNVSSLDTVMKEMWRLFGTSDHGYSKHDVYGLLQQYGGEEIQYVINDIIEGTMPLESLLEELLPYVGYDLKQIPHPEKSASWAGFRTRGTVISEIAPNATLSGTLSPGDEVVKIGEETLEEFDWAIKPGDQIPIVIRRNMKEYTYRVKIGYEIYFPIYELVPNPGVSAQTMDNRFSWINVATTP